MSETSKWVLTPLSTAVLAAMLAAAPARAQEEPGHQHDHDHGAASDLGVVHFPTSCDSKVTADFDRAVALLHSFVYDLARDAFRAVAAKDSRCGIAWWGVAMTYYHPLWAPPTPEEAAAGSE